MAIRFGLWSNEASIGELVLVHSCSPWPHRRSSSASKPSTLRRSAARTSTGRGVFGRARLEMHPSDRATGTVPDLICSREVNRVEEVNV
jgi:hypothetical protein